MTDHENPTGAQVRGQIQAGETGDKRSGFDPAAAPMETDAEAGGAAITPEQARIAVDDHALQEPDVQKNYDSAMRKPQSTGRVEKNNSLHPVAIVLGCVIALASGLVIYGLINV